uniref:Uncharacterized protein n=1 Tax=Oryza brachyantha TaxID=4533 RepID=J3KYZ0_ORYBR
MCSERTRWRSPTTRSMMDSSSSPDGVAALGCTYSRLVLSTVNPMLRSSSSSPSPENISVAAPAGVANVQAAA